MRVTRWLSGNDSHHKEKQNEVVGKMKSPAFAQERIEIGREG